MRIERDKLIWLALATLAEQVEQAHAGPPPPSHGVRLALAVLHLFSGGDREPFTDFWRQMRQDCLNTGTPTTASYCRPTYLQSELRGVMRAVGIEPCVATEMPLSQAALKVFPRRSAGGPA
jgi:hypothetical protein